MDIIYTAGNTANRKGKEGMKSGEEVVDEVGIKWG